MAHVIINGITYQGVPGVDIPRSDGGSVRFYDTSDANVASGDILTGKTAFGVSGVVQGSMANNGTTGGTINTVSGTISIPMGFTSGGIVNLSGVTDCVSGNILSGKSILGVNGSLTLPTVSQDSTTKILTIQ